MSISKITAIARPIDPNYPTNRAMALLTMAVIVGGSIYRLMAGVGLLKSLSWGIGAGLAVFLAWALCRELDPDHDLSAFVAAGLTLIALFFFDLPGLTALFWMIVLLRIVNRTVGLPATILDSLLILGLGSWLTLQGNWIYGLMTALAFLLDSQLPRPHRRHLLFAAIALLVTVMLFVLNGSMSREGELSALVVLAALAMSALFLPVIIASRKLRTVGDQTGELLNPRRVQAAQALALLMGILVARWNGYTGLVSLMPLWAAVLGASLYRCILGTMERWVRVVLIVIAALLVILLIAPFLIPVPPLEDTVPPQQLADPDSRFVDINGLQVHYKMAGQGGPALVLLHGFGASVFSWREVMEPLAEIGTVIAFDRPAFGLTERPVPGEWEGESPYRAEAQVELTVGLLDELGDELPNAELVVIPHCGHIPHEECPEPFLQAVTDFVGKLP